MASLRLPVNTVLQDAARLPSNSDRTAVAVDYLVLLGFGVVAATCTILADFGLKIPGHAILRVVLPFACGLALVPRHGAGSVMGVGALIGGGVLTGVGHYELGAGATTSLLLTGPLLDLMLRRTKPNQSLYWRMALAGFLANAGAFLVRGGVKWLESPGAGKPLLAVWGGKALVTYSVCGLIAGLLSAFIVFRWRTETTTDSPS